MEGRDEYRVTPEKHLPHDLPPITPEQIALEALVDNITQRVLDNERARATTD